MFYVLLAVAAVITAAGFYKFVYFISIGYAFSVVGLAVAMLIGFGTSLTLPVGILLPSLPCTRHGLEFLLLSGNIKTSRTARFWMKPQPDLKKFRFLLKSLSGFFAPFCM